MKRAFLLFFTPIAMAATEPPQTFASALETILSRHTDIGIAAANSEIVEAKNLSSTYSLLPSLALEGSQTFRDNNTSDRLLGVTANLNLFKFGADAAAMRAAGKENASARATQELSVLKAEDEAVAALVAVIQSEKKLQILTKIRDLREDTYRIAQERYQKGLVAKQEASKFLVDLENSKSQETDLEQETIRNRANLQALLGHDAIEITWPWTAELSGLAKRIQKRDESLSERPDWKAAEAALQATEARKDQAFGQALPSLDLNVTYGINETIRPEPRTTSNQLTGTITLSIPLFDRLVNYGSYRAAVEGLKASSLEFEKIKRQAQSEWISSRKALETSVKTVQSREKTLSISRDLYEDNVRRYRRAMMNANELMNDQERLYASEIAFVQGWADFHLNLAKVCHASGKRVTHCLAEKGDAPKAQPISQ